MIASIAKRVWEALVHPKIRLQADFPWGIGTMAKQYLVATFFYIVGSFLPLGLFFLALFITGKINPALLTRLIGNDPNHVNMYIVICVVVASFVSGFGLELWYIRRCFHKDGLSLRKSMAINLDSLGGSWWAAIWRALIAFGLVIVLEVALSYLPLPEVRDPAAKFASGLSKFGFLTFALLASVVAPVSEELVFRGFLFNVCRTSFRQGFFQRLFHTHTSADYAAIATSAAFFAAAHMNLAGFPALFLMGCILASLYRRSGSLICPMLLHAFNNAAGMIVLFFSLYS